MNFLDLVADRGGDRELPKIGDRVVAWYPDTWSPCCFQIIESGYPAGSPYIHAVATSDLFPRNSGLIELYDLILIGWHDYRLLGELSFHRGLIDYERAKLFKTAWVAKPFPKVLGDVLVERCRTLLNIHPQG